MTTVTSRKPKADRLAVGEDLLRDEFLTSANGRFKFIMQGDGNFVLYDRNRFVWTANSSGADKVLLQGDGNLVVYEGSRVRWASGTQGQGDKATVLILQEDGNAVIFMKNRGIWGTETKAKRLLDDRLVTNDYMRRGEELTSPNQKYRLKFTGDAKLVLCEGDKVLWSSPDLKYKPDTVQMQEDDNLSINGEWTSGTRRRANGGKAVLYVRDSGDAIIVSEDLIIWSTKPEQVQAGAPVTTAVSSGSDQIKGGQYLSVGQSLVSSNKQWTFTVQTDGNLVVRRNTNNEILWVSNTSASDVVNLTVTWKNKAVLYGANDREIWSTGTSDIDKFCSLVMQDDGNLTFKQYNVVWQTGLRFPASLGTTDRFHRGERLALDQDLVSGAWKMGFTNAGHLKITKSGDQPTYYYVDATVSGVKQLVLTDQGILEFKDGQNKVLTTQPVRAARDVDWNQASYFALENDGKARIYDHGKEVWSVSDLASGSSATTYNSNNALGENEVLVAGSNLWSSNGRYKLAMQTDGNLVLYNHTQGQVIWTAVYDRGDPRWPINGSSLVVDSSGNLYLYRAGMFGQAERLWSVKVVLLASS